MKKPALVRAAERIERANNLDATIATTNNVVSRLLPPGPLRNLLHGGPLGHPAHPIAILVPAGAWISAAVLDFIPGQERAARTLVGVGLIGVTPAASAGIADWSVLGRTQQRVGIVHWAANLTAVALYSASYVQRRRGKQLSGRVLGLAGLSLVSASGYLGGHLAYRQGANVLHEQEEPDFAEATAEAVGTEWHTLGLVDGLQHDRLVAIESNGVPLMALRHGLEILVLAGTCSYCDDDLTAGTLEQGEASSTVECAQDGSVFDLATGAVLRGPASSPLPLFETLVDAGMVEIRRAAPTA